jgi:hypothetical protein
MLAKVAVIAEKGNNYTTGTPGRSVELGLQHLEKYEIFIESYSNKRLITQIEIDGKIIGEFIIKAVGKLRLLGVPNQEGEFTFIAPGTPEFTNANLNKVDDFYLGLIQITITPEKQIEYNPGLYEKGMTMGATRSGGTGLTGANKQDFMFGRGFETDETKAEHFGFKLIHKEMEVKPIVPTPVLDMSVFDSIFTEKYDAVFTGSDGNGSGGFTVRCDKGFAVENLLRDLTKRGIVNEVDRIDWGDGYCVAYRLKFLEISEFFDKVKIALAPASLKLRFVLACD